MACRPTAVQHTRLQYVSVHPPRNFTRQVCFAEDPSQSDARSTPEEATSSMDGLRFDTTSALVPASASPNGSSEKSPEKKSSGLSGTPAGSAVENATSRFALPTPTLAVRNLVRTHPATRTPGPCIDITRLQEVPNFQIEASQYAHLCTTMSSMHHRRAGYPFGMLIDFAADGAGSPVFCLSKLSIHSHNLRDDPRCSLVVQMPGWLGLSDARVTIFGDAYELPAELQRKAKEIFEPKYGTPGRQWTLSDSLCFYRMMDIRDIYFVGGFGTMQWVSPAEYAATTPDSIVTYPGHETVDAITERFGPQLVTYFLGPDGAGSATVISIDAAGADVRVKREWQLTVHRFAFPFKVHTPEEAIRAVQSVLVAY